MALPRTQLTDSTGGGALARHPPPTLDPPTTTPTKRLLGITCLLKAPPSPVVAKHDWSVLFIWLTLSQCASSFGTICMGQAWEPSMSTKRLVVS